MLERLLVIYILVLKEQQQLSLPQCLTRHLQFELNVDTYITLDHIMPFFFPR